MSGSPPGKCGGDFDVGAAFRQFELEVTGDRRGQEAGPLAAAEWGDDRMAVVERVDAEGGGCGDRAEARREVMDCCESGRPASPELLQNRGSGTTRARCSMINAL